MVVSMGRPGAFVPSRPVMVNMAHDRHASPTAVDDGSIQVRSPKTLVTARPSTWVTVPSANWIGARNQSLAYTSPNSMRRSLLRSVVSGWMSPKLVAASSKVHHLVCGMPSNWAFVGKKLRVTLRAGSGAPGGGNGGPVSVAPATSKLYQSRCPPWYSSAISVRGPVGVGAERATPYSR